MMLSNRIKIEQILLLGVLVSLVLPLAITLPLFRLATWNIPGLMLLLWIVLRGANRQRFRLDNFDLWEYSILGVILIYFIMTILGREPLLNIASLNHYISCLILALYIRRSYGKILTSKNLIVFAFISVGLESIIGLIQQITSSEFGNVSQFFGQTPETLDLKSIFGTDIGRIHGTLGTGNLVGNWINLFIPFIIFSSKYFNDKDYRIWRSLIVILSLIAIILSISRFNIALYIAILLFSFLLFVKNNLNHKIKLKIRLSSFLFMIIIMTVSIGSLVVFREDVYMLRYVVDARFSDTFEEASEEGKATSGIDARMEMNKGALQAFMRSPLIGVGYKNSRWIWPTVDAHVPDNWVYQPHNVYMVMLVEGGILLFIIYVVFTFYPFFKLWRCRKSNEPLMIAYFLSLTVGIGIQMIYITFTSPGFAAVYTMILGCAMGYFDQELIKLKGKS